MKHFFKFKNTYQYNILNQIVQVLFSPKAMRWLILIIQSFWWKLWKFIITHKDYRIQSRGSPFKHCFSIYILYREITWALLNTILTAHSCCPRGEKHSSTEPNRFILGLSYCIWGVACQISETKILINVHLLSSGRVCLIFAQGDCWF